MRFFEKLLKLPILPKVSTMSQRYTGFTLAEVLITVGIIGIVAEMTIPSLLFDFQKQQWVTQLQKSYTMFNQALIQLANDYGCPGDLACTDLFASTTPLETTGDAISSYFKIAKNCSTTASLGCFSNSVGPNYDGSGTRSTTYDSATGQYRFITADGVSFRISSFGTNCATTSYGVNSLSLVCGYMYIDVNGLNKPNNKGRDIFFFYISNGKGPLLYPNAGKDMIVGGTSYYWKDNNYCSTTNPIGAYCTARIIDESWQMKY